MTHTNIKQLSRRSLLKISLTGISLAVLSQLQLVKANTSDLTITVWKTPTCGCCKAWVAHLRQNGFHVVANDVDDTSPIRKKFGFPDQYGSCHTAKIGDYIIEGHVPAADIRKLLKDKPLARGLSVPGMPLGSPGMEGTGRYAGMRQAYDVLLVLNDDTSRVFKSYTAISARNS